MGMPKATFDTIEAAIQDLRRGKMVIVVDDETRENEGDLVMAADKVTPEAINFMSKYGRGLICVPMVEADLQRLNIDDMVDTNTDTHQTAFTVSVDALDTHTGISAHERARTIERLVDPNARATDFKRPGHMFPLKSKAGGTLERPGHTEAAIDLARLAGCRPAGIICEILNDDGTMARLDDLKAFKHTHQLKLITIADLIRYQLQPKVVKTSPRKEQRV
jgi:3,4-dihydroxy 2-butanone 4-phosphate synthase/GTP cyclohydrolase II